MLEQRRVALCATRRMSQERWSDGVGGWVYKLQPGQESADAELSVLFEQGRMGSPNGMAWNLVRPLAVRMLSRLLPASGKSSNRT